MREHVHPLRLQRGPSADFICSTCGRRKRFMFAVRQPQCSTCGSASYRIETVRWLWGREWVTVAWMAAMQSELRKAINILDYDGWDTDDMARALYLREHHLTESSGAE